MRLPHHCSLIQYLTFTPLLNAKHAWQIKCWIKSNVQPVGSPRLPNLRSDWRLWKVTTPHNWHLSQFHLRFCNVTTTDFWVGQNRTVVGPIDLLSYKRSTGGCLAVPSEKTTFSMLMLSGWAVRYKTLGVRALGVCTLREDDVLHADVEWLGGEVSDTGGGGPGGVYPQRRRRPPCWCWVAGRWGIRHWGWGPWGCVPSEKTTSSMLMLSGWAVRYKTLGVGALEVCTLREDDVLHADVEWLGGQAGGPLLHHLPVVVECGHASLQVCGWRPLAVRLALRRQRRVRLVEVRHVGLTRHQSLVHRLRTHDTHIMRHASRVTCTDMPQMSHIIICLVTSYDELKMAL